MDESALIAAAQQGDVSAFNRLVLAYQQLAYSVAYRVLGNPDSAMDATQDAFLRAYRALSQYNGGSFRSWLLRIVTNCCYDQLRSLKRRPATPLDDLVEDEEHSTLLLDQSEEPEDRVERTQLGQLLQRALLTLPDDQRAAVVLCDVQGLSYEEAAAAHNIALGTVKSRLSRGRAKLRDYLLQHRELLPNGYRHSFERAVDGRGER
jgi:RNA polymerase sigma-70 factor (ECF subfamily)